MKYYIESVQLPLCSEQYAYQCDLKRTLDSGGHCVLEMPSGTGKTISLLSLIVSYQAHMPERRKLIYCSRTMSEIEKALAELKSLMKFREKELGYKEEFRALGLTSRKNLCLHPSVKREKSGAVVDARCRSLTASFVKEQKERGEDVDVCVYHDNLDLLDPSNLVPSGVFTLDGLLEYGEEHKQCPYFSARRMMPWCNVIIYSYHYLLDPKIAERVSKELSKDCIVVFDEAHNIDNVCIESLSIDITNDSLTKATKGAANLERKIEEMKLTDEKKLQDEYQKLVQGLQDADTARTEEAFMSNPVLPDDLLKEAVPGNIRRAEHFVAFLKRFIEYIKTRMKVRSVIQETPPSFLAHLKDYTFIEKKPLRFCAERLTSLVRTLELSNIEDYQALQEIATFATLVATYETGFLLILEPYETDQAVHANPIFHFVCLDAAIAIKPVLERFSSVVITSGTISPLDMYPKMLAFDAVVQESYQMSLARKSFLPMVVTRGSDQQPISSGFQVRSDPNVVRNYGNLLYEFAKITPDGMVVFFPSYLYMEMIISMWQAMNILDRIWEYKLLLVETPDAQETSLALETYRTACENGKGAILLCVARGKVSEGIDFDHHFGRTVLCMGAPFQYTESRILKARLEFLRETYGIKEQDFLSFDAMRHAAQCLGRVLRGKDDYGIMVLADRRFQKKRTQLPKWIASMIDDSQASLSTDAAVGKAKRFLREIAQPPPAKLSIEAFTEKDLLGKDSWIPRELERWQAFAKAKKAEGGGDEGREMVGDHDYMPRKTFVDEYEEFNGNGHIDGSGVPREAAHDDEFGGDEDMDDILREAEDRVDTAAAFDDMDES
ncbi:TFIIH/NER complex ATP-dependent 5'-3' DNA helicase subunit [Elasticomyces elasticus]|nr:TFIIH/NER complex ATP-dependent 5'-3' DNA helicase subunit [Elasticomyces elasticus]